MPLLINLLITALAVILTAYLLPGVVISGFMSAFIVAIVLGLVNTFIKPVILFLTLPINIMTIGLLTFVINALLILLISEIVPGFRVNGFWWAMLFSIVLSVVNSLLYRFIT